MSTDNEITVLWCHTKIEAEARIYTKGNWLPNHFVPILLRLDDMQSVINTQINYQSFDTVPSGITESEIILNDAYSNLINNGNMATPTVSLPITKLVRRTSKDAIRKRMSRSLETSDQRALRLSKRYESRKRNQANETEEQARTRLAKDSSRKALSRLTLTALEKHQRIQKDNIRRRIRTKEKLTKVNSWPTVVPYNDKRQCLQNFTNRMSKSNLSESTCALCNIRAFSKDMVCVLMIKLKNQLSLRPHIDIAPIIPGYESVIIDDEINMEVEFTEQDYPHFDTRM
jgi:hypothetical protein